MAKVDVLLGLQWGDEGKGKIVDVLTPNYDMVARFQGGPNAGHTLHFDGKKYVLRSIPSGIFQKDTINVVGNGVVLDPVRFIEEAKELQKSGCSVKDKLRIARKAHLILPTHRLLDAANEKALKGSKIGTTGRGIGPTYTDKTARYGVRVGEIEGNFDKAYNTAKERHLARLAAMGEKPDLTDLEKEYFDAIEQLKTFKLIDCEYEINGALKDGKKVLAEGAQGSMLDVDYGTYPFVTSSNTIASGCCTGLGIAPQQIGHVFGIFKAYCTRVGAGPFPTELQDEVGHEMAVRGAEFGAVTGRPRRCGWIDLVALKYTVMLSGVTDLIMMKSDVLDTFKEIKACRAYRVNGKETQRVPFHFTDDDSIEPIYDTIPGWQCDLTAVTREADFPAAFRNYIAYLENALGCPIKIVSVGPDRKQTIIRS